VTVNFFQANLSCEITPATFGVLYTRTNFVTLKYFTDSWGTKDHGFTLVITAFKDAGASGLRTYGGACRDGFKCGDRNICIDKDLVCDNVNHCGDEADERSSHFCSCKYFSFFYLIMLFYIRLPVVFTLVPNTWLCCLNYTCPSLPLHLLLFLHPFPHPFIHLFHPSLAWITNFLLLFLSLSSYDRNPLLHKVKMKGSLFSAIMSVGRICPCLEERHKAAEETSNAFPGLLNPDANRQGNDSMQLGQHHQDSVVLYH